jgi:hypothetical protein
MPFPDRAASWDRRCEEILIMSAQRRGYMTNDELEVFLANARRRSIAATKPRAKHEPHDRTGGSPTSDAAPTSAPIKRTGGRPPKTGAGIAEPRLTRGYVAQVVGVDVSTVRGLEARGELHPEIGDGGIRYFDLRELLALKSRRIRAARDRTVDIRLAAFELFRQGVDWRDVAIKLRYDPYRVHRLWRLYTVDEKARTTDADT